MTEDLNERTYEADFGTCLDRCPLVDLEETYYTKPLEEKKYGYDARFDLKKPGIPIFIQFKVPNKVSPQKACEIANRFKASASSVNLCMPLNPVDGFRQHHNLIRTENRESPCLTLYSTPKYSTQNEHRVVFKNRSVHQHSVYFVPTEIGKIGSVSSCNIGYSTISKNAVLYSHRERVIVDSKDVKAYEFPDMISLAVKKLQIHNVSFERNIDEVYNQKIGKNVPVQITRLKPPKIPPEGTLGYIIAHTESVNIDRDQQGYYSAKINMLAKKARDEMEAKLFLFQHVGGKSFLFQSAETALGQDSSRTPP